MSNFNPREIPELLAKLSDGMLTPEDAIRLNQLLKEDDIAQQAYLDHFLIDGLLEREFRGTVSVPVVIPSSENLLRQPARTVSSKSLAGWSNQLLRFSKRAFIVVPVSMILIFAIGVSHLRLFTAREIIQTLPLLLSNSGFEYGAPQDGVVASEGIWFGDSVEVVGSRSKVDPLEGDRMLRFVDNAEDNNESVVYQLVDLGNWDRTLGDRDVAVWASAHFNASGDDEIRRMFSIRLYAFPEKPVCLPGVEPMGWGRPLVFSGRHFVADVDVDSWENAAAHLNLTPEARYLVIQLSVINPDSKSDDESEDYFVDKVAVRLVASG